MTNFVPKHLLDGLNKEAPAKENLTLATYNVLMDIFHNEIIFSSERFIKQFEMLKILNFDILGLTEVTWDYLSLLKEQPFVQDYNIVTSLDYELYRVGSSTPKFYTRRKKKPQLAEQTNTATTSVSEPQSTTTATRRSRFPESTSSSSNSASTTSSPSTPTQKKKRAATLDEPRKLEEVDESEKRRQNGCALLSKYPVEKVSYIVFRAAQAARPALFVLLSIPYPYPNPENKTHVKVGVVVLHLKAFARCSPIRTGQLKDLFTVMEKQLQKECDDFIVMGDWNICSQAETAALEKIHMKQEFVDLWTSLGKAPEAGYTFDAFRNPMIGVIDPSDDAKQHRYDRIIKLVDVEYRNYKKKLKNRLQGEALKAIPPALIPRDISLFADEPMYAEQCVFPDPQKRSKTLPATEVENSEEQPETGPEDDAEEAEEESEAPVARVLPSKETYLFPSDHFGIQVQLDFNKDYFS